MWLQSSSVNGLIMAWWRKIKDVRVNRWETPPLIWHTPLRANTHMETDGAASPLSDLLCSREILRKTNDSVWAGTLVIQIHMSTVSLSPPPRLFSYKSQSLELLPAVLLIETVMRIQLFLSILGKCKLLYVFNQAQCAWIKVWGLGK